MEQTILNALENAEDNDISSKEELAQHIAVQLKRAIAEQLMSQLDHL